MALRFEPRTSAALAAKLRTLTPEVRRGLVDQLGVVGLRIERSAKRRAPKLTGALRKSIRHQVDPKTLSVTIGTDLFYSRFVEFGTAGGLAGARSAKGRAVRRSHPGTPARPFLWPAYKGSKRRNQKEIAQAIRGRLARVARR